MCGGLRLAPGARLRQLGQPPGLLVVDAPVLLSCAAVDRFRDADATAGLGHGLAWGDQRLDGSLPEQPTFGPELADVLFGSGPGVFHGRVHGSVWPPEVSHSPCCGFRGPRQHQSS